MTDALRLVAAVALIAAGVKQENPWFLVAGVLFTIAAAIREIGVDTRE